MSLIQYNQSMENFLMGTMITTVYTIDCLQTHQIRMATLISLF